MTGGGPKDGFRAGTPRAELARIRESRERHDAEAATRIEEAMLTVCGEQGFRNVSVQAVIERGGGYRVLFYSHFASKADCYAAAYESGIEALCGRLLDAARAAADWRGGLRAALEELAAAISERPHACRGLFVEVHVAGGRSLAKRAAIIGRLSDALDGARREAGPSPDRPPRMAAAFLVGAVEASVTRALVLGKPCEFATAVPALAQMIEAAYFGEQTAEAPTSLQGA